MNKFKILIVEDGEVEPVLTDIIDSLDININYPAFKTRFFAEGPKGVKCGNFIIFQTGFASQAWDILREHQIHIAIIDCQLPLNSEEIGDFAEIIKKTSSDINTLKKVSAKESGSMSDQAGIWLLRCIEKNGMGTRTMLYSAHNQINMYLDALEDSERTNFSQKEYVGDKVRELLEASRLELLKKIGSQKILKKLSEFMKKPHNDDILEEEITTGSGWCLKYLYPEINDYSIRLKFKKRVYEDLVNFSTPLALKNVFTSRDISPLTGHGGKTMEERMELFNRIKNTDIKQLSTLPEEHKKFVLDILDECSNIESPDEANHFFHNKARIYIRDIYQKICEFSRVTVEGYDDGWGNYFIYGEKADVMRSLDWILKISEEDASLSVYMELVQDEVGTLVIKFTSTNDDLFKQRNGIGDLFRKYPEKISAGLPEAIDDWLGYGSFIVKLIDRDGNRDKKDILPGGDLLSSPGNENIIQLTLGPFET